MKIKNLSNQQGSLLIEILLAVAIAAIIIGGVSVLISVSLKSGQISGEKSAALGLAEEGLEAMKVIGESDWHNIYLPPDGLGDPDTGKGEVEANAYYVYKKDNGGTFSWDLTKDSAKGNITVNGIIYIRKIYIFNVTRNKTGPDRQVCIIPVEDCPAGELNDPSTQRIKVKVSQSAGADIIVEEYLTRWRNNIYSQADWSQTTPATQAGCESVGGVWDIPNAVCYAKNDYPNTQATCVAAGGIWDGINLSCSITGQNDWRAYGEESAIDNTGGTLKLKP